MKIDSDDKATHPKQSVALMLGALGVVFGDIGTSPLYALKECFSGHTALAVTPENIFGILSLVFWSLMIVISFKYVLYVMRADNNGEGGILSLMALAHPTAKEGRADPRRFLIVLGLIGAVFLYGDGIITPAISVLSAVEGLGVVAPTLRSSIVPLALALLWLLFAMQKHGTDRIGRTFGPILLLWFSTLATLGIRGVLQNTEILNAISPHHAIRFISDNGWIGFLTLGSVFLVVTGGEALYADMGHFGRKPISQAWFFIVLPSLLLNYFGQGALLLNHPSAASNPFFLLAPEWARYPLVFLAAAAAVIASQALITGTFSLTKQAIQLGYLPRQRIVHTSQHAIGQIYLPTINTVMLIGTILLVAIFQTSSALAAAYGLAVTSTMVVTTILIAFVAKEKWDWNPLLVYSLTAFLVVIDLAFFASNLIKIPHGGWIPLSIGAGMFILMSTWQRGRYLLRRRLREKALPVQKFIEQLSKSQFGVHRVGGTAIFMSSVAESTPAGLLHNIKHNSVIHETTILLTVRTEFEPHIQVTQQVDVIEIYQGIYSVVFHYGFMDLPDVPLKLSQCLGSDLKFNIAQATYFLGRESLVSTERPGMARWRERLFVLMSKNAQPATDFFRLPADQVFEVGLVVEI